MSCFLLSSITNKKERKLYPKFHKIVSSNFFSISFEGEDRIELQNKYFAVCTLRFNERRMFF